MCIRDSVRTTQSLGTKPPTLRLSLRLRGAQVKWVYPKPDNHDPERYFQKDATFYWYEFKSSSTNSELMSKPSFCGHEPGPRTHFVIEATRAYSIVAFSCHGEEEAEVLFRPLAKLVCIIDAVRNIINPKEKLDISKSCLLYTSPSPRDRTRSRMPSSA